jgi:hypothetical protein
MEDKDPPNSKPWTDSDKADLESLLQERRHRKWLADSMMQWAKWVAAIALGATVVWDWIAKIIKQAGTP